MKAHFDVFTQLDKGKKEEGIVEINRDNNVISVRAKHGRKSYALPLDLVASIIVAKVIKQGLP